MMREAIIYCSTVAFPRHIDAATGQTQFRHQRSISKLLRSSNHAQPSRHHQQPVTPLPSHLLHHRCGPLQRWLFRLRLRKLSLKRGAHLRQRGEERKRSAQRRQQRGKALEKRVYLRRILLMEMEENSTLIVNVGGKSTTTKGRSKYTRDKRHESSCCHARL
ncbi:hypothetical protein EV426DRAFT_243478 [Tirmania nivea]|nr:hypothetical protein EV426DRAFT_243478 [Tirmania nivea]